MAGYLQLPKIDVTNAVQISYSQEAEKNPWQGIEIEFCDGTTLMIYAEKSSKGEGIYLEGVIIEVEREVL